MLKDFNLEDSIDDPEGAANMVINYPHYKAYTSGAIYRDHITAAISGGNAKNLVVGALPHDKLSHLSPDKINTLCTNYTVQIGRRVGQGVSMIVT